MQIPHFMVAYALDGYVYVALRAWVWLTLAIVVGVLFVRFLRRR